MEVCTEVGNACQRENLTGHITPLELVGSKVVSRPHRPSVKLWSLRFATVHHGELHDHTGHRLDNHVLLVGLGFVPQDPGVLANLHQAKLVEREAILTEPQV